MKQYIFLDSNSMPKSATRLHPLMERSLARLSKENERLRRENEKLLRKESEAEEKIKTFVFTLEEKEKKLQKVNQELKKIQTAKNDANIVLKNELNELVRQNQILAQDRIDDQITIKNLNAKNLALKEQNKIVTDIGAKLFFYLPVTCRAVESISHFVVLVFL